MESTETVKTQAQISSEVLEHFRNYFCVKKNLLPKSVNLDTTFREIRITDNDRNEYIYEVEYAFDIRPIHYDFVFSWETISQLVEAVWEGVKTRQNAESSEIILQS